MGDFDEGRKFQQTDFELGDFKQAMSWHLNQYGGKLAVQILDDFVVDSARARDDRPAYIKIAVDDSVVQELRGNKKRNAMLLVDLPMSTVLEFAEKRKAGGTRLITPNQVGMSPSQILSASGKAMKGLG